MRWAKAKLLDVAAKKPWALNGGPFGSKLTTKVYTDSGVPVIRGTNLSGPFKFSFDDFVYVSEERADELRPNNAHPGDLVFTQRGTIGQVGLIPINSPFSRFVISQSQMKLTPDPDQADSLFLYYYFSAPGTVQRIQNLAFAAGVPHINLDILRNFEVLLPPIPAQRRVAAILSAYDDLIENNTRRIAILERMARALYREWFVDFRFPGHEKVKMVESPNGSIPDGWKLATLGAMALNLDRKRKPLSKMEREKRKGPYPYYGAAKVFDYIDDFIFDGEYLLLAEDGSVVTKAGKPVLQLARGKFWANNHTHILQGRTPLSTQYLYLVLSEVDVMGYVTGAAQPKITQENLNRIPVLVPESGLLERFQRAAADLFAQMNLLERKNATLRTTRDLLLPKLISGEIDVSNAGEAPLEATA
jgi:type I restriction enzyme S subunit